jgi:hypothetical protein
MNKVVPFRNRYGVLDHTQYYDGPDAKALKEEFLFRWIQGASLATNMSVATAVTYPGHEYYLLTRAVPSYDVAAPKDWKTVVSDDSRYITKQRLGLGP